MTQADEDEMVPEEDDQPERRHTIRHRDGGLVELRRYYRSVAIKAMCTECLGYENHPKDCTDSHCPLFPYRGRIVGSFKQRTGAEAGDLQHQQF